MSVSLDLTGKTAFVTGCTSGLGRRMATCLAEAGAAVTVTGRREELLTSLVDEITQAGGKARARALDVTDEADLTAAMDEHEAAFGPIDILLNNAGVSSYKHILDCDAAEYDFIMNVNTKAMFVASVLAAKRMIASKTKGRIISISSIGGDNVLKGNTLYCMSKAAVKMMTESLARDFAKYDINVNAIAPGYIETELNADWFASEGGQKQVRSFPRRRLGDASDLDGALLLLCSDAGSFISGSTITVDDAQSKVGL